MLNKKELITCINCSNLVKNYKWEIDGFNFACSQKCFEQTLDVWEEGDDEE